ncbi:MAG: class I SAM-dependent methyltransferase [Acidobacteria bacterium]|nr:class I SAM-dependent methyltransferase [Candidatus Sulfomarinibacter sp. MAG AM2]
MARRSVRFPATLLVIAACLVAAITLSSDRDADRETWQPPEQIMDAVGVRAGMRIGEAGAGEGYLTFHLARRVGDRGVVYANEISEGDLETIRHRAQREDVDNIVTVLGEIEDPLFPEKDLDMVIMVYVLHHLDRPIEFLQNLEGYLKPDAPVVIIEKNHDMERSHPPQFMTGRQVLETIEESGYELEKTETFLPRDTIYIYRVRR